MGFWTLMRCSGEMAMSAVVPSAREYESEEESEAKERGRVHPGPTRSLRPPSPPNPPSYYLLDYPVTRL